MKKLIALLICVGATAILAHAAPAAKSLTARTSQAVDAQVDKAQRVVKLSVNTGNLPPDYAIGKAVVMGTNPQGDLVLLTSQSLAIDIDVLGDDPLFAAVVKDDKMAFAPAPIVNIASHNPGVNQHFYVITLKKAPFKRLPMITEEQARKLL